MKRKLAFAATIITAALFALPAVAGAHVDVSADGNLDAAGAVTGTLSIPNECVDSATTSLDLNFPKSPTVKQVEVTPVPDWTAVPTTDPATDSVTKLTVTGSLTGSDTVEFPFTFSGIPAGTEVIEFTALQTCADGEVFRWVQPTVEGDDEPEFPAPVLRMEADASTSDATTATPETKVPVTTGAKKSDDSSSTGLIIGIVAASLVLVGAGAVMFRRSKP